MPVKLPNLRHARNKVEAFNKANPIGTRVVVTKDDKSTVETVTRSAAQLLSGHTPVIWLEGFPACYLLDRVKVK